MNAHLHQTAQHAAFDDLVNALVIGRKMGLLEDAQHHVVFLCGADHGVAFLGMCGEGLFHHHVKAMGEQVHGDGIVQMGIGAVDDQVDIRAAIQLAVIGKDLAAVFFSGPDAAFFEPVNDSYDVVLVVLLAAEEVTVNVAAASSLTDDGNSEFFHGLDPSFPFKSAERCS